MVKKVGVRGSDIESSDQLFSMRVCYENGEQMTYAWMGPDTFFVSLERPISKKEKRVLQAAISPLMASFFWSKTLSPESHSANAKASSLLLKTFALLPFY